MVSEVIEVPVEAPVEQEEAPAEELSEETPDVTFDESPVEAPAEDAAPAPSGAPDVAKEIADLRRELAELREKQQPQRTEAEIRADLEDGLRRQRQQDEEQRQQEQAWKDELNESLQAVLVTKGYTDIPAEDVRTVGERFINRRYDQIAQKEVGEVRSALMWLREGADGEAHKIALTPKSSRYANDLADSFNTIYQTLKARAEKEAREGYVPTSEREKWVEDEIAKRNAKARKGDADLVRIEGQPSAGGPERGSPAWWSALGTEGRKDRANIAAFDAYTAAHR
jgi:hypothetical protein